MKLLALASLFAITACSSTTKRYCEATSVGKNVQVNAVAKSKETTRYFSFLIPEGDIINFSKISRYSQKTINHLGESSGGGNPEGGFIAFNYRTKPPSLEIHLLTYSECSCHHLELHKANGSYTLLQKSK